ncbi:circularly permuted type 2 ATP-grasp protein [Cognatazoarcus halotolerans]|uniref:circularly permuted type 2 ATP-grasp protein n=1 Tax=Cognatazoarcus halotolerans TaxID=2686016 RepID=UPI001358FB0F|nr:circularly permuted type 2 ATP-grasp protein [Cognatazoarcus halotolerans]MBX3680310.1 circularly permuted type 2 ATP-grasp protein [Rhodocyclaceae bacterium]MCB1898379.1 circularly permuted type 2 ATP-grasp protein [Rhodocyclaceae bacterium]MCP5311501.1 circularly permuted type 2 ATP-grasp protein [Zoogloeaceae bacterium]
MPSLLQDYPRLPHRFDEMRLDDDGVRPQWAPFVDRLELLPSDTLQRRARYVRESIEADGVTYNVYEDPKGVKRPWELDLLPLIVDPVQWETLSDALAQRAHLLNLILADLYGPQTLIADGLIPPALIFGQLGYKWPCRGIRPPGGIYLHHYAADLARAPDGEWWVLGDRTQGPSGTGYTLQNRIILSRTFPDAFRDLKVQTLASFFRASQEGMSRLAPTDGEAPLAVLLTPGPFNETYFEHAFLARYLGFPLVEGQDLTVRDDTVYLKTLRGLRRVHAIYRRLDDDFCDPLELRSDSALGVPGLLQAVRAGRVLMANALGSGVLETGALLGFLPAIAERLLGEPLKLPAVASWWCGEEPALEYVLSHLDELVIKPTFPSMRMETVFGYQLKGDSRTRMIERIRAQPHAYVAQEWVRLSQAPVWSRRHERRIVPRSVGLRMFAAATPDGYTVMPGALTRVSPREGDEVVSMQRGGLSKDTWVRTTGPVPDTTMLKTRLGVIDLVCSGTEIPSRVGENLFWMGRYAERCEGSARVLRAALTRVSDTDPEALATLPGVERAARNMGLIEPPEEDEPEKDTETLLLAAVSDPRHSGSLASCLYRLSGAASQVRERLSSDNWRALNRLSQLLTGPVDDVEQALLAVDQVMQSCIALAGFAMDDMTRDEGWGFLIVGRRLERLAIQATLLAGVLRASRNMRRRSLEWLLETGNSIVTYRARYRRAPELLPVLHLLAFDVTNPHSVAFQLDNLRRYLQRNSRELGQSRPLQLDALSETLRGFDLTRFEADSCDEACEELADLLFQCEAASYQVSDELQRQYFAHTGLTARMGGWQ